MDYLHSVCPKCGQKFNENDDIVVCPECGTPEHRSCYLEEGNCVNLSLHGTDFSWQPQIDNSEIISDIPNDSAKDSSATAPVLDNRYALLFIRGERPIQDLKFDILGHKNVALTTDGKEQPYEHGEDTRSVASISFDPGLLTQAVEFDLGETNYELLSDEEMEEYFRNLEDKNHEENQ